MSQQGASHRGGGACEGEKWRGRIDAIVSNGLSDLFTACQTVEAEDEEEVSPPPSDGHFNNCVPVWHDSCRTG